MASDDESVGAPSAPSTTRTTGPKFGGTLSGNSYWIGGPPNRAWTATTLQNYYTPFCIRGLDPSTEMKGYAKRVTEGNPTKLKQDDSDYPLMAFAADALEHMKTHGMDTVFCMQGAQSTADPGSDEGAMELFTYHTRYTKSEVEQHINQRIAVKHFDVHCKTALQESGKWLAASLDESLKKSLRSQLMARPSGPVLWMMIVAEVQSDSLRRCVKLADKFEKLDLTAFKGENVRDYCATVDDLLTQLERDEQLPRTHLLKIVDVFTACSVLDFKV